MLSGFHDVFKGVSPIYNSIYTGKPGWGGYAEFRYGKKNHRRVWNPAAQSPRPPSVKKYTENAELVANVARLLDDHLNPHESLWAREAETLYGLRRGLLSDGLTWAESEATAFRLVRLGFMLLNRGDDARPAWDEGQRYHTEAGCRWCGGEVEEGRWFCSAEHAALAKDNFDHEGASFWTSKIGRIAHEMIRREASEPRQCEHCNKTFRPVSDDLDTKFCSHHCYHAHRARPVKSCVVCGNSFTATHGEDQPTCSLECRDKWRAVRKHPATCEWCFEPFLARQHGVRFCCKAHATAYQRAAKGWWPAKLSPPVFDHAIAA